MEFQYRSVLIKLVVLGCFWGFSGCNYLFYYPHKNIFSNPKHFNLDYEQVEFKSRDGTQLTGWFIPAVNPKQAKGTMIQFHGNAENMTSHFRSLVWLPFHQYNLFTFDYRGYGKSEGEPDLHGPIEDSIAAIEYIRKRSEVDQSPIILIGQSLGGALAIAAVGHGSKEGITAVIIESTFSSYQRITRDKLGDVVFTWPFQWPLSLIFIRDTYSPEDYIGKIAPIPVLLIHGTHDPVVPYYHSKILYDEAKQPKFLWTIENGRHTEAFTRLGGIYQKKLLQFLEENSSTKTL